MNGANNSDPLFQNPLLEKLTHTNAPFVILSLFAVSLAVLIYGIFSLEMPVIFQIAWVVFGFLFFTLAEYLIHRFVFHSGEYTKKENWQYKIHGIHHAAPRDKERLAMPLPLALLLASAFFFLFWIVMGSNAFFFFPGFLSGYAFYLSVHYIIHTRRPPANIFRYLWKHHHIHHYKHDNTAFGVTTPFWDIVFRTMPPEK